MRLRSRRTADTLGPPRKGASSVPVWYSEKPQDSDRPDLVAQTPGLYPDALAVASDGTLAATAVSGTISVSPLRSPTADTASPERSLFGVGSVNSNGLAFVDGDRGLASATGDAVALWNTAPRGRITTEVAAPIHYGCNACGGPSITISPDGRNIAVLDANQSSITVLSTADGAAKVSAYVDSGGVVVGATRWSDNSNELVLSFPAGRRSRSGRRGRLTPPRLRSRSRRRVTRHRSAVAGLVH